jgi:hypothetical protein
MSSPTFRPSLLAAGLYTLGMVVTYLGQRVVEAGKPSHITTAIGVAIVLASAAVRLARSAKQPPAFRGPERTLLGLTGIGFVALLCYFASSDLPYYVLGKTLAQGMPRLAAVLAALWPALWLVATLPTLFIELSLWGMARAPVLDTGRLRSARLAGFGIASCLVFVFGAAYVASERDVKADLSYFRTTKPGDSTKKIVQALDKEVQVHIFFPPANEVREEVEAFFSELARVSKFLVVNYWDHALHPGKARELDVSGNGVVVVQREGLKEKISLPLQLEAARSQLRMLDGDVNKRLLGVTRRAKVAYFVTGHGERTENPMDDTDKRPTIKGIRQLLTDMSFEPRELSIATGLGTDVPADAGMVLIIGPRKPLMKEESAALLRYLDKNGRLFIALDPDGAQNLEEVLAPLALKYRPTNLANDKYYLSRTYQKTDREILTSAAFSSHVSVSSLSKLGARAPVIVLGAGYLEKDEKTAVGIVNVDFTVHADNNTFPDKNGDFEPSEGENRNAYELAAAVNKRNASALLPEEEGRAVVIADSDAVSDLIIGNRGNVYLVSDGLRWLGGEERLAGMVNNEEDVAIIHTRKQDMVWFYSSIFAAPALVLAIGFRMSRRRRKARGAGKAPEAKAAETKPAEARPEAAPAGQADTKGGAP